MQDLTKAKRYDALAQSLMGKQYGHGAYDGLNALLSAFAGAKARKTADETWAEAYKAKFAHDNAETEKQFQRQMDIFKQQLEHQNRANRELYDYKSNKETDQARTDANNKDTRELAHRIDEREYQEKQAELAHKRKLEIIQAGKADKQSPAEVKKSPVEQKELAKAKERAFAAQQTLDKLTEGEKLLAENTSFLGGTGRIDGIVQTIFNPSFSNDLDALVEDLATSELKARFGGNPTEGERASIKDTYFSKYNTEEANQAIINRKRKELQRIIDNYKQLLDQGNAGLSDNAMKWLQVANGQ